ncbi:nuclear transport factor 2 family protein [Streptomyces iconiensis]|uniref:Nuclear transport factor 2 family protein n=1 Tax=Streptomyces iconiensis TaxID=1384038 RepID=A0ABT7AA34_9ACTN|nr:nuclear transport factor 2 family protein [Streptomyces iconiensis]MDJ1138200.1 nuclear transport factor 2 family protein [Streptomyces iconiensis]
MRPVDVVAKLWDRIEARDWGAVGGLMAEDAVIEWPVSGERIVGRDNFVAIQSEYPEGWSIRVLRVLAGGEDSEQVASEVEVPHTEFGVFRAASFWTVSEGRITAGREYWTDLGGEHPPEWRTKFTEPI